MTEMRPAGMPEFRVVRDVNGHAGGESRDMRVTLEVTGRADTIAEVVEFVRAAPTMYRALGAILARMNGVFDDPDLVSFGPLSENESRDVQRIACHALEVAEGNRESLSETPEPTCDAGVPLSDPACSACLGVAPEPDALQLLAGLCDEFDYTRTDIIYGGGSPECKAAWLALTDAERAEFIRRVDADFADDDVACDYCDEKATIHDGSDDTYRCATHADGKVSP